MLSVKADGASVPSSARALTTRRSLSAPGHGIAVAVLALVATLVLIAGLVGSGGVAKAAPPQDQVSFSTPTHFPRIPPGIHDYVVRCHDGPVTVNAHASGGVAGGDRQPAVPKRRLPRTVPLRAGRPSRSPPKAGPALPLPRALPARRLSRLHLHPLRAGVAGVLLGRPRLLAPRERYAMISTTTGCRSGGTRPGLGPRVLPSGTCSGSTLRVIQGMGDPPPRRQPRPHPQRRRPPANAHDLQLLAERRLPGRRLRQAEPRRHERLRRLERRRRHQRRAPAGEPRRPACCGTGRARTTSRWPRPGAAGRGLINHAPGYDIVHWNSIEPDGNSVIASFRHLDAVYKIRKSTGDDRLEAGRDARRPKSLT